MNDVVTIQSVNSTNNTCYGQNRTTKIHVRPMNENEEINHYFSLKNVIFFSLLFGIVAILCVALFMVKHYYSKKESSSNEKKKDEFEAAFHI